MQKSWGLSVLHEETVAQPIQGRESSRGQVKGVSDGNGLEETGRGRLKVSSFV